LDVLSDPLMSFLIEFAEDAQKKKEGN